MTIKNAKVKFVRFGARAFFCSQTLPKVVYLPHLEISYIEKGRKEDSFQLDYDMVSKENYKGIISAKNFVVVWAGNNYLTYSESGVHLTTLNDEIGRLVSVDKTNFCVAKEKTLFAYNEKGNIVGQREITKDELKEKGICRNVKKIIEIIGSRIIARHQLSCASFILHSRIKRFCYAVTLSEFGRELFRECAESVRRGVACGEGGVEDFFYRLEDYGILGALYAGVSGWLLSQFLRELFAGPLLWRICGPCLRDSRPG